MGEEKGKWMVGWRPCHFHLNTSARLTMPSTPTAEAILLSCNPPASSSFLSCTDPG